ncbi:RcnB family protein [Hydrogenophaga sp.]|uniref:RcnB family protein n=1 Tax=Hydrogenophaga sp. TaxID=1904254 RepID=UPI00273569BD|nr:RcnB family protein [Hydrogenophaga sp.]MDP3886154.1 RcnB family protein [Hydrogenophaga sp.]
MKSRTLVSALLAATLGLSSLSAFAQPNDRRGDKRNDVRVIVQPVQHVERRDDRRNDRVERRDDRRNDRFDRRDDHRDARNNRNFRNNHRYYNARSPEFRRGHYIPYEYRHRQYFVVDHRGHRLAPPPRGHQWVQVGTDYVLIAIATGLIANIILNH